MPNPYNTRSNSGDNNQNFDGNTQDFSNQGQDLGAQTQSYGGSYGNDNNNQYGQNNQYGGNGQINQDNNFGQSQQQQQSYGQNYQDANGTDKDGSLADKVEHMLEKLANKITGSGSNNNNGHN